MAYRPMAYGGHRNKTATWPGVSYSIKHSTSVSVSTILVYTIAPRTRKLLKIVPAEAEALEPKPPSPGLYCQ
jgi:hypothetical protein